jgi:hypothetical protein
MQLAPPDQQHHQQLKCVAPFSFLGLGFGFFGFGFVAGLPLLALFFEYLNSCLAKAHWQ